MTADHHAGLTERLRRLDACAVSDAIDRLGVRGGAALGLGPVTIGATIVGPVRTIKLGLSDGSPAPFHLGARAIDAAKAGEIIVVANAGRMDTACWGGTLTRGAKRAEVAGVILDGGCRDVEEARELGMPVYARGTSLRAARGRVWEEAFDIKVHICGIHVSPGDFVIADANGVVFIAREAIDEVTVAAEHIVTRESAMAEAIDRGVPMTRVMGADYEALLTRTSN